MPAASHAAQFDCGLNAQPQPGLVNSMSEIDSFSSPLGIEAEQWLYAYMHDGPFQGIEFPSRGSDVTASRDNPG